MSDAPRTPDAGLDAVFADPPPPIGRFNWGAFLIPPIWGVANGQWPGVFFLALWVFIDNVLRGPQPFGIWSTVAGAVLAGVTIGAQALYAANANRIAWYRMAGRVSPERFARRQRLWGIAGGVTIVGMGVWITLFILGYGS
ncbi:MAG: hypothetical protein RQ731_05260 [Anaerosomatales bacterium]|nr:hypothetical protein [Anaerosomatales bacterium]MDT8434145.1 hypothetical protein [Anaerosomatales bacterium]